MTLQDIYDQLTYGPLKNLFVASRNMEDVGIEGEDFKSLFPHIQLGLNAIHSRMFMREGRTVLELEEGKVSYLVSPTEQNLLEIEQVWGVYCSKAYEIPLDELDEPVSIRRTSHNSIIIPDDAELAPWLSETTELTVVYRANHPEIKDYIANSAPLATEIFLPSTHLQALLLHVAGTVHTPIGMKNEFHAGRDYRNEFDMEMQRLELAGFDIKATSNNTRLRKAGFP